MLPSFRVDLSAHGLAPFTIRAWHIVVAAFVLFLVPIVGEYLAIVPWGSGWPLQLLLLMALPVFLGIPLSLLALIVSPRYRRQAMIWFVMCAVGFAMFIAGARLGVKIRHRAFEDLAARSAALVNGIASYEVKYGESPRKLDDLVPEFLAKVPGTGMGAYPEYRFVSKNEAQSDWDGNPWALYVDCGPVFLNFDRFIYLPLQNYPKDGYGGSLERIGAWAYVHE
jgi:hypothetical protein